jgi:hypothetical protein
MAYEKHEFSLHGRIRSPAVDNKPVAHRPRSSIDKTNTSRIRSARQSPQVIYDRLEFTYCSYLILITPIISRRHLSHRTGDLQIKFEVSL